MTLKEHLHKYYVKFFFNNEEYYLFKLSNYNFMNYLIYLPGKYIRIVQSLVATNIGDTIFDGRGFYRDTDDVSLQKLIELETLCISMKRKEEMAFSMVDCLTNNISAGNCVLKQCLLLNFSKDTKKFKFGDMSEFICILPKKQMQFDFSIKMVSYNKCEIYDANMNLLPIGKVGLNDLNYVSLYYDYCHKDRHFLNITKEQIKMANLKQQISTNTSFTYHCCFITQPEKNYICFDFLDNLVLLSIYSRINANCGYYMMPIPTFLELFVQGDLPLYIDNESYNDFIAVCEEVII